MSLLTKSKYLIGLQCPKYLWILLNQPEKIPEVDVSTQHRFDQGHIVGQLAKELFPDGIDIPEDDFKENLQKSKELLKEGKPLFEVAFCVNNLYSRADILVPNGDGWDIIEVKSGTSVKEVNIHDVSFQKYVYELAGLKIKNCFLLHVNNEFVKKGEIDPKKFFTKVDITQEVEEASIGIKERIEKILEVVNNDLCPDVKISKDCADPYTCPLEDECWGFLPESSVFDLYRGGKKCFELFEDGVHAIADIPGDFKLNDKQGIQHKCEREGKIHIDKVGIKRFLDSLKKPVHYLDFETFSTAVPLFDGVKPYQQIPFQFSLHVDGKHHSYLADGGDCRADFIKELRNVLGDSGSVVVFNQSFEKMILKQLAEEFPNYKEWVESVFERIVDLIVPFRNFAYYNPKQKGSCSLKKVLPAITGKDYSNLDIADGGTASVSYLHTVFSDCKDKLKIREDLEKYCGLDTEGMVWIVEKLRGLL